MQNDFTRGLARKCIWELPWPAGLSSEWGGDNRRRANVSQIGRWAWMGRDLKGWDWKVWRWWANAWANQLNWKKLDEFQWQLKRDNGTFIFILLVWIESDNDVGNTDVIRRDAVQTACIERPWPENPWRLVQIGSNWKPSLTKLFGQKQRHCCQRGNSFVPDGVGT